MLCLVISAGLRLPEGAEARKGAEGCKAARELTPAPRTRRGGSGPAGTSQGTPAPCFSFYPHEKRDRVVVDFYPHQKRDRIVVPLLHGKETIGCVKAGDGPRTGRAEFGTHPWVHTARAWVSRGALRFEVIVFEENLLRNSRRRYDTPSRPNW